MLYLVTVKAQKFDKKSRAATSGEFIDVVRVNASSRSGAQSQAAGYIRDKYRTADEFVAARGSSAVVIGR